MKTLPLYVAATKNPTRLRSCSSAFLFYWSWFYATSATFECPSGPGSGAYYEGQQKQKQQKQHEVTTARIAVVQHMPSAASSGL